MILIILQIIHWDTEWWRNRILCTGRAKQLIKDAVMENDFLKNLDAGQVREIVDSMYPREFEKGSYVIREGDAGKDEQCQKKKKKERRKMYWFIYHTKSFRNEDGRQSSGMMIYTFRFPSSSFSFFHFFVCFLSFNIFIISHCSASAPVVGQVLICTCRPMVSWKWSRVTEC